MINIIYGLKGSGKTKKIIDAANSAANNATGNVVFLTDTKRYMYDLNHKLRFVDVKDFGIDSDCKLLSFIKGIVAGNADTQYIFVDGVARITDAKLTDLGDFFKDLEALKNDFDLNLVLSISAGEEDLPDFIKKFTE